MADNGEEKFEKETLTIPTFVAGVLQNARAQANSDHELLDILEKRIVSIGVPSGSPEKALQDIETLAEGRANVESSADEGNGSE